MVPSIASSKEPTLKWFQDFTIASMKNFVTTEFFESGAQKAIKSLLADYCSPDSLEDLGRDSLWSSLMAKDPATPPHPYPLDNVKDVTTPKGARDHKKDKIRKHHYIGRRVTCGHLAQLIKTDFCFPFLGWFNLAYWLFHKCVLWLDICSESPSIAVKQMW